MLVGLAKGKQLHDKREDLKIRDLSRQAKILIIGKGGSLCVQFDLF